MKNLKTNRLTHTSSSIGVNMSKLSKNSLQFKTSFGSSSRGNDN